MRSSVAERVATKPTEPVLRKMSAACHPVVAFVKVEPVPKSQITRSPIPVVVSQVPVTSDEIVIDTYVHVAATEIVYVKT